MVSGLILGRPARVVNGSMSPRVVIRRCLVKLRDFRESCRKGVLPVFCLALPREWNSGWITTAPDCRRPTRALRCVTIGLRTLRHYWSPQTASLLVSTYCITVGLHTLRHYRSPHIASLSVSTQCVTIGLHTLRHYWSPYITSSPHTVHCDMSRSKMSRSKIGSWQRSVKDILVKPISFTSGIPVVATDSASLVWITTEAAIHKALDSNFQCFSNSSQMVVELKRQQSWPSWCSISSKIGNVQQRAV